MKNLDYLDWAVVDQPDNPVSGDTEGIARMAWKYKCLSRDFSEMASALKNLDTKAGMQGEWVVKFEEKLQDLPRDFGRFADSFGEVSCQLRGWMQSLDGFQSDAKTQLERAIAARDEKERYERLSCGARSALTQAGAVFDELPDAATDVQRRNAREAKEAAQQMLDGYSDHVETAGDEWADAKRRVCDIRLDYESGAHKRAGEIAKAQEHAPAVNGFEKFHYSDGWQCIVSFAKAASAVLAIVSLFVSGWGIALAVVALGALLLADKYVDYLYGDASFNEVIAEGAFLILSIIGSVRCLSAGLQGFKTASVAKSTGLADDLSSFKLASGNIATNLGECRSVASFGILTQYSKVLSTYTKVSEGMTFLGDVKRVSDSVRVIASPVGRWGGSGRTLRTVLYYAGREHLLQKGANLAGHAHDFVLDQVKYGRRTLGPWDVAKMFIPGLVQLNDAADAVNNAGEGFVYAGSAIRSFMVER